MFTHIRIRTIAILQRRAFAASVFLIYAALIPPTAVGQDAVDAQEMREQSINDRYVSLLKKRPRRGTAFDKVFAFHLDRGSLNSFVDELSTDVAQDDNDGGSAMVLGMVHRRRGNDAAAIDAFRQASTTRADDAASAWYLGEALIEAGQQDEAATALEEALQRRPARAEAAEIYPLLGRLYQRSRDARKSLDLWRRYETAFPDDDRVQEQIATILAAEGELAAAINRYAKLANSTTDAYRRIDYGIKAARLQMQDGQQDAAIVAFEALLQQLKPGSWLHGDVRRSIEQSFLERDDVAGLVDYYQDWVSDHPDDVDAMARTGRYLAWQGLSDDAALWYRRAIEKSPTDIALREAFIEHLMGNRQYAAAIEQSEVLVQVDAANMDAIERWGKLYLRHEQLDQNERQENAARIWKRLLPLKPNDASNLARVADLLRSVNQTEEAISLYKQAIELQPSDIQYREYLGEYYHSLNRPQQARQIWKTIAAGERRTTANLIRLSQIYSRFDDPALAIATMRAACDLTPDFTDLVRFATLLRRENQTQESLAALQRASALADSAEEHDIVINERIRSLSAAGQLQFASTNLATQLEAQPNADGYRTLARQYEALNAMPEASAAARKGVELDPTSVAALSLVARISEKAGLLAESSAAYAQLVDVDRRSRPNHLRKIAELERRLGRIDRSILAGQDLIAAAPNNPEHYQFFAELCFSAGRTELAEETLRQSVRANPGTAAALRSLAAVLADNFKTQEAIDLYWRAFQKAQNQDERLSLMQSLTELHLRTNQFDRLVTRLENIARDSAEQRDMVMCLASVYQVGGDLGKARETLEQLLEDDSRDVALLKELTQLAEQTSDFQIAADFQRQLNDINPSSEGTVRLANLLTRSGNDAAAKTVWATAAASGTPPHEVIASIDQLLAEEKFESAKALANGLLQRDRQDWEALLRLTVIAAATDDESNVNEFSQRLLALNFPGETGTHAQRQRKRIDHPQSFGGSTDVSSNSDHTSKLPPVLHRELQLSGMLSLLGTSYRTQFQLVDGSFQSQDAKSQQAMLQQMYYTNQTIVGNPSSFTNRSRGLYLTDVDNFATGRAISVAAQTQRAAERGGVAAWLQQLQAMAVASPIESQHVWDWYFASIASHAMGQTHALLDVAAQLAQLTDAAAQLAVLNILLNHKSSPQRSQPSSAPNDLNESQRVQLLGAALAVAKQQPEWLKFIGGTQAITAALEDTDQSDQADEFFTWLIREDASIQQLTSAVPVARNRNQTQTLISLANRIVALESVDTSGVVSESFSAGTLGVVFAQAASELGPLQGDWDSVDRLLKQFLVLRSTQVQATLAVGVHNVTDSYFDTHTYPLYQNGEVAGSQPFNTLATQPYWSDADMTFFVNLSRLYGTQRSAQLLDVVRDVRAHASGLQAAAVELAMAQFHFLFRSQDAAALHLVRAAVLSPDDTSLRLNIARFHEQAGHKQDALALLNTIVAADQATIREREMLAMSLASDLGHTQRAEQAASRLFGLSLTPKESLVLASKVKAMKMTEMADALLARVRKIGGNDLNTLVTLMNEYAGAENLAVANQIAHQVLRRTAVSNPRQDPSQLMNARTAAIKILSASGQLDSLIDRVQTQLARAPNSLQLHQTLKEYYVAAGRTTEAANVTDRIRELEPMTPARMKSDAQSLFRARKYNAACDLYFRIMAQEPQHFSDQYYQYIMAFRNAGRTVELADHVLKMDVRQLRNNYQIVSQLVQTLFLTDNGSSTSRPLAADRIQRVTDLLNLGWDAFPANRSEMISGISEQAVWDQPVMLRYVSDVLIPQTPQQAIARPWNGVAYSTVRTDTGRMTGIVTRLERHLNSTAGIAFAGDVQGAVERYPEWRGGRLLLAVLKAHSGAHDEAASLVEQFAADESIAFVPLQSAWVLATELTEIDKRYLKTTSTILAESLRQDTNAKSYLSTYVGSPQRFLLDLLNQFGRRSELPRLIASLELTPQQGRFNAANASDKGLAEVQYDAHVGDHLSELGFPLMALRYYERITPERVSQIDSQASASHLRELVNRTSKKAVSIRSSATANDLVQYLTVGLQQEPPAIDLLLHTADDGFQNQNLKSSVLQIAQRIARRTEDAVALSKGLNELMQRSIPAVSAVPIVATVVAEESEDGALLELAIDQLADHLQYVSAHNIPTVESDIALWIPARIATARPQTHALGFALLDRCEIAAQSSVNDGWLLSILRWRGEIELAAGNRSAAEAAWSRLLDAVLQDSAVSVVTPERSGAANSGISTAAPNIGPPRLSNTALQELRSELLRPTKQAP